MWIATAIILSVLVTSAIWSFLTIPKILERGNSLRELREKCRWERQLVSDLEKEIQKLKDIMSDRRYYGG